MQKVRAKTISEQVSSIKAKYPDFHLTFSGDRLRVIGKIKPTARSVNYSFEIKYPALRIHITSPELSKNSWGSSIPHVFSGKRLCLYQPKYKEFKRADLISEFIIPWISLWLYYYEVWQVTNKWMGGGEHPITTKKEHSDVFLEKLRKRRS